MADGILREFKIENTEQKALNILKYFPHIRFIYCRDGVILEIIKERVEVIMTRNGKESIAKFDENGAMYSLTGAKISELIP